MTMNKSDAFSVALIQMRCDPSSAKNLERAEHFIRHAARAGAGIICLPELFLSPYFCQSVDIAAFDRAETIPGPTTERLTRVAKETSAVIVASLFERRTAGVFHNAVAVIDADGALLGIYRKMHIPDDPLYHEKYYFTPGDLGFRCFDTKQGRIGTLICWDQWFPEAARLTALRGAEVLLYPTAIGWHPREKAEHGSAQYDAWQTIQRAHAIANGVFVAAVNRVGHEGPGDGGGLDFWGGSFVSDPFGVVLKKSSHESEEVLIVECDRARLEDVRRNWPFLRDRRIDAYGDLTRRMID
jgi:N-carbamoylputrescine amidase